MTAQENLAYTQDAIRRGDFRYAGQMGQDKLRQAQAAVAAESSLNAPPGSVSAPGGRSMARLTQQMPALPALLTPPTPAPLPTGTVAPGTLIPAKTQSPSSRRVNATVAVDKNAPKVVVPKQTAAQIARNEQNVKGRRVTKASLAPVPGVAQQIPGEEPSTGKGRRFSTTFGLSGINVPE